MKANIINNLITSIERAVTADASLSASFEAALKAAGFKIVYRGENPVAKGTQAMKDKFNAEMKAALEKHYGNIREGKGKTAANRLSALRAEYGMAAKDAGEKAGKWSKKQVATTVEFVMKSFKLDASEAAGFLQACARAARATASKAGK